MPEREIGGIKYTLTIKDVKNMNMRIKKEGVFVSMPYNIPMRYADAFVYKNRDKIEQYREKYCKPQYEQLEIMTTTPEDEVTSLVRKWAEKMAEDKVPMPDVRIREMKSMWGNCYINRNFITLNKALLDMPREYLEYVIIHELAHFIHKDHQKGFWALVSKYCPGWKEIRKNLKKYAGDLRK
ncbi:MAG: M48 family metallopeptidase [Clostridia bacterium]|nr:M48 family metallopeptidase [Clostridia bacterium]